MQDTSHVSTHACDGIPCRLPGHTALLLIAAAGCEASREANALETTGSFLCTFVVACSYASCMTSCFVHSMLSQPRYSAQHSVTIQGQRFWFVLWHFVEEVCAASKHQQCGALATRDPHTLISDRVFRMTFDCVCTVCSTLAGFSLSTGSPRYAAAFTSLSTACLQSPCSRIYDIGLCIFHHTLSTITDRFIMPMHSCNTICLILFTTHAPEKHALI